MSLPYHRGHTAPSSSSSSAAAMSKHRGGNGYPNAGNGRADEVNTTLMEMENNSRWEELGSQVSLLKELSMDINSEVKNQNRMLDGMGSTFGTTSELFKNTIGKLGTMLNTGGSNHMFYLIGFIVFLFILLYYLMGRK